MNGIQSRLEPDENVVAIYHCVYFKEGFEQTAQILFQLVKSAEREFPGVLRRLYLDIEGHRNRDGRFDPDVTETQTKFLPEVLAPRLSEFTTSLGHTVNPSPQDSAIPPAVVIRDP